MGAYLGQIEPGTESSGTVLATVLTGVASLMQVVCGLLAVYYVVAVATADKEELEKPRQEHAVVEQLARGEAAYMDAFAKVTNWTNLGTGYKALIMTAALLIMLSCPVFAFCEKCFENFCINCEISKPLEENGLDGNAFNLVHWPHGHAALLFFALGCVLHLVFVKTTEWLATNELRQGTQNSSTSTPGATMVGATTVDARKAGSLSL